MSHLIAGDYVTEIIFKYRRDLTFFPHEQLLGYKLALRRRCKNSEISLPVQAYDVSPVVYRTVNVEALVTYCQNGYSVPWRYIGSMLPVRITEKELIVYGRAVEEIARHAL
jgi:hypothetical protein